MGAGRRLAVVAAVMRAAGISGVDVLESREARVRLQKVVFLLAEAGVVEELGGYSFSLYIHGPYSPALADDYYRLARGEVVVEPVRLSARVERLIRRLAGEPVEVLEIAATLLDIVASHLRAGLLGEEDVKALVEGRVPRRVEVHLRAVKPWAGAEVVGRALRLLTETGLLQRLAARVRAGGRRLPGRHRGAPGGPL